MDIRGKVPLRPLKESIHVTCSDQLDYTKFRNCTGNIKMTKSEQFSGQHVQFFLPPSNGIPPLEPIHMCLMYIFTILDKYFNFSSLRTWLD